MRLLSVHDFTFSQFEDDVPPYAILSHRWTQKEPRLRDIEGLGGQPPEAYPKIYGFSQYVRQHLPDIAWIWVDSCCVNQDSTAELSESINRMFKWYRDARICLAYLPDVEHPDDRVALRRSVWFTRGWTLQELLASTTIVFLTSSWQPIGYKGVISHLTLQTGILLETILAEVTRVPLAVIKDFSNSHALPVEEKMKWMEGRRTLKEEDLIYALFGVMGLALGANYGEGRRGAELRLRTAMRQTTLYDVNDISQSVPKHNPKYLIPFSRDSAFVDRSEMLDIEERMAKPGTRLALAGMGGVGKSQLAIEHCYRVMDRHKDVSIFWLHASGSARFDQDIARMADDLGFSERAPTANVFRIVRDWLIDVRRRWLIILDGVDDLDYLLDTPSTSTEGVTFTSSRLDYIPVCLHGSFLMTTRNRMTARRIVGDTHVIVVEPEHEHAESLVMRHFRLPNSDTTSAAKIARALDYFPLAITQAASYVHGRTTTYTFETYLAQLDRGPKSRRSLLQLDLLDPRRDRLEAKNSITTLLTSFEQIADFHTPAAWLLSFLSFLDTRIGVPELLIEHFRAGEDYYDQDPCSDSDDDRSIVSMYGSVVLNLRDYFLITTSTDGMTTYMSRLVQTAVHLWLVESKQYGYWQERAITALHKAFTVATTHRERKLLLPHVVMLSQYKTKSETGRVKLRLILRSAISCTLDGDDPDTANELADRLKNRWLQSSEPALPERRPASQRACGTSSATESIPTRPMGAPLALISTSRGSDVLMSDDIQSINVGDAANIAPAKWIDSRPPRPPPEEAYRGASGVKAQDTMPRPPRPPPERPSRWVIHEVKVQDTMPRPPGPPPERPSRWVSHGVKAQDTMPRPPGPPPERPSRRASGVEAQDTTQSTLEYNLDFSAIRAGRRAKSHCALPICRVCGIGQHHISDA